MECSKAWDLQSLIVHDPLRGQTKLELAQWCVQSIGKLSSLGYTTLIDWLSSYRQIDTRYKINILSLSLFRSPDRKKILRIYKLGKINIPKPFWAQLSCNILGAGSHKSRFMNYFDLSVNKWPKNIWTHLSQPVYVNVHMFYEWPLILRCIQLWN